VDTLTQQKYELEADVRRLEVEVGPIKYIAEMVYGDQPDANTLEKAVRIMIILLVIVFDPLAVLMLIAANWTLLQSRPKTTPPPKPQTPKEPEVVNTTIESPEQPAEIEVPKEPLPKKNRVQRYISDGVNWISRPPNL
jgi:hypothetical protein